MTPAEYRLAADALGRMQPGPMNLICDDAPELTRAGSVDRDAEYTELALDYAARTGRSLVADIARDPQRVATVFRAAALAGEREREAPAARLAAADRREKYRKAKATRMRR